MYDLLIKNGRLATPKGEVVGDVLVKDEKIVAIGKNLEGEAKEVIDATALVVTPGMIDSHTHISEPGRTEWEGYLTGTSSAVKGGVTSFVEMPLNQLPCSSDAESIQLKYDATEGKLKMDVASYGGLIPTNLDDLEDLDKAGVVAYKAFLATCGDRSIDNDFRNVDDYSLWEGMRRIAKIGKPLALHCENAAITDKLGQIHREQGPDTLENYVASRPVFTEVEAVKRALFFAEQTGVKLSICHCSCSEAIQAVKEARDKGLNVVAETCTHYLYFSTDELDKIGPTSKCSPPIRDKAAKEKMWEELFNGNIRFVGSDHSPCTPDLKNTTAFKAWGGISALQHSYDVLFDEAVNKRNMSLQQFVEVTATNAAEWFGLDGKGAIAVGYDADFCLIDPNAKYTIKAEDLEYKNKISAYVGREVGCTIKKTIVRGNVVYSDGKVCEKSIGKLIKK